MKKAIIFSISITAMFFINSCSEEFLDYIPTGVLSESNVATAENAESLLIAAYAGVMNDDMRGTVTSQWMYGSVRSDDAYKGGGGVGDVSFGHEFEVYYLTTPEYGADFFMPRTWKNYYNAISRINVALNVINDIPDYAAKNIRQGELRFLRAHCHFMLKVLFKKIPYITEDLDAEAKLQATNDIPNDELWDKIAADFLFAYNNLPVTQSEAGRANKSSAAAYLAKLKLFQAYVQNDNHQVTSISQDKLQDVILYADEVVGDLETDYGKNFMNGYENGPESIWAAQFSINDGTNVGRLSYATGLNSPHGNPLYGCCGFHLASQNMANAFRTDEDGLPYLDTFNDVSIFTEDAGDGTTPPAPGLTVDPRIDHTMAIPGRPFKYRNTVNNSGDMIANISWARVPGVYGYMYNMKEQQAPDCSCYYKNGPFMGTSRNIEFIRYADVLLMKAEALIQLDRKDEALPIINQVRTRAKNSTSWPTEAGASDIWNIGTYPSFPTKDYAWKALKFERRLEFAMEGHRWYDLVRWGEAAETLNKYLEVEKVRRPFLGAAVFTPGRDEYYPIPQKEIDFTGGSLYKQNPGY